MPAGSDGPASTAAAHLAAVRRAARGLFFGAARSSSAWSPGSPSTPRRAPGSRSSSGARWSSSGCSRSAAWYALVRSRVVATTTGSWSSTATAAASTSGPRSWPSTCRRGAVVDPRPRRRHHACRRWASRAPTATGRAPPYASSRPCSPRLADAESRRSSVQRPDRPRTRSSSSPGSPAAPSVTRSRPLRNASAGRGHRLHRQRPPGGAGHVVGAEDLQPPVLRVDPQRDAAARSRGRAAPRWRRRASSRSRSVNASSSRCRAPVGRPGSRTPCRLDVLAAHRQQPVVGSSRVAAGRVSSQPVDRAGPDDEVGVRPAGVRRGVAAMLVAVWVTVSPSADRS